MAVTMQRRQHSADFKAKVALESIEGQRTMNEIAGEYRVHPGQIAQWKKQVLEELPGLFSSKRAREARTEEELRASLYQEIGQLKVELDWMKRRSCSCQFETWSWFLQALARHLTCRSGLLFMSGRHSYAAGISIKWPLHLGQILWVTVKVKPKVRDERTDQCQ